MKDRLQLILQKIVLTPTISSDFKKSNYMDVWKVYECFFKLYIRKEIPGHPFLVACNDLLQKLIIFLTCEKQIAFINGMK